MNQLSFDYSKAIADHECEQFATLARQARHTLVNATGAGNDFLGWISLPQDIQSQISDIQSTAAMLRQNCEFIVCIGIGGSYLGAKAVIEALSPSFAIENNGPEVLFAGNNISEDYLWELQQKLLNRNFGIVCISKSGTTTEPAIAFRLLKQQLENQIGKEKAQQLIVCITDRAKGALRTLAQQENYKTFVIEDNIGGRFSVLSPVGLLPIACAGFDIQQLIDGAKEMYDQCASHESIAEQYAAVRNYLYSVKNKKIELLVNYNPKLHYIAEWWKQLYGESEGKDGKGIFPAAVDLTTDLHSMGQYIQDGERILMETVISVQRANHSVIIPNDENNLDGLNFMAGKHVEKVNQMAQLGTQLAHVDGGVPNMLITLPCINEYYLGELIYFFEFACGISGYMLGINPFNQPGVEAYKKNMFALLDKPGYERESKLIKSRL
ncbi:MAG: glucose-6-phosphate isomerase [Paludibacteraceae bacterium]|nr:glucose-6-phosphate isomerase [Paludibacteraceae bacterium]